MSNLSSCKVCQCLVQCSFVEKEQLFAYSFMGSRICMAKVDSTIGLVSSTVGHTFVSELHAILGKNIRGLTSMACL